ncbi:MAG: SGNH/GDSL hydrolase family protein [Polyangiaceae bacterium]|nr:SGNH/GDSL hydrolase family protein [Polyangiaceae bacterium]
MTRPTSAYLAGIVCLAWGCSGSGDSTQSFTGGSSAAPASPGGGTGASVGAGGSTGGSGGNAVGGGQASLGGQVGSGELTSQGGTPPVGGQPAGGGTPATGGLAATGGSPGSTGGVETGGQATGGQNTGGVETGGQATGGQNTGGVETGGNASGGASTGGSGTGGCEKGTTAGNEVVIIGESFIAMSSIPEHLAETARAEGSLQQNESYIDNSVSGTTLANDQIPSQYRDAQASNDIRFVVMDGGGNDCLQANNPDGALSAAQSLFETMAQDGVEKVQYFFYPDPIGSQYSSLQSCLDTLRPQMQALCEGLTAPKCYWLDLRPVWDGHDEYTSDGIHPTEAGSVATADAIWEAMVANCIAQ